MMRIGMNTLLWTENFRTEEHQGLLWKLKNWDFDGVELVADAIPAAEASSIASMLREVGLQCTTIAALDANVADPASKNPMLRRAAADTLKLAIRNTKELGAELLCGPLFQGLGRFTGRGPEPEEWNYAVETIREAGEYAQDLGIRLALEPLNRFEMYMVNTLREGMRFCREVGLPNVGLLADTHHGNIEESDVETSWQEAAEFIYHVHISENHRGVPGSGHAVPPALFRLLQEIDYDGWLTIEAFSQTVPGLIPRLHIWRAYSEHTDDAARLGIDYIRRHLKAGGTD
ncbi:sugar phosphate isomerase/epimerase family protein [Paenibacillus shunpengii]|uniref:Sugar phosphate isomerase/epimerase family protein n=1 Tax=Paenibacillus shunpengii TaxID=2054424 RepID=A0ABW5SRN4_9BACL|nr:sugar phosphate isomerase/epimerase family protein [Paenibacillus sp. PDC88]SDX19887.1 D-psicose/D-tagatose/L-ribulose 3-epimerase [Paenibacillus sp. PDC88]